MNSRFSFLTALAVSAMGLASTVSHASITLQFGQTGVARATGFANNAGTPTNGMNWGIIIDSLGNGFSSGYDVFSSTTSGFLSAGGGATDDYYVTTGLLTSTQSATGTDPGGVGGITALASIFTSYPANVGSGDAFKIAWFDGAPAAGSFYGLMSDATFLLPPDGNTNSYAAVFTSPSADPAKPATFQFAGAVTPEPSRLMLLGLAGLGLVVRRRRC